MTETNGVVSEVSGGVATVEVMATSGCGRCHEPGGCGGGLLNGAKACAKKYEVENSIGAKPGDEVTLVAPDGAVLTAALWAYGLPCFAAIAGAALGLAFSGSESASVLGGLAGLLVGVGMIRLVRRPGWRQPGMEVRFRESPSGLS